MITLSGFELSQHMLWTDRDANQNVLQASSRTLGGLYRAWAHTTTAGRPITLEAVQDAGWLTYEQVQEVQAMADVAGATYELDYHGEVFPVIFRHEEAPAFQASPLVYRAIPLDTDWYVATIRLITF